MGGVGVLKLRIVVTTALLAASVLFASVNAVAEISYLRPNELEPHLTQPIFDKVKPGAYLAVGSERGFLTAGLNPSVTALVVVDRDPQITQFARLNALLLKISINRADYLNLRNHATQDEILSRLSIEIPPRLPTEDQSKMTNEDFAWWQTNVRDNARNFVDMNGARQSPLNQSSYLLNDTYFARVQRLAKSDNIKVFQGNLLDADFVRRLTRSIANQYDRLTAVDLSNAWDVNYMGANGISDVVDSLWAITRNDTMYVFTDAHTALAGSFVSWNYLGISREHLVNKFANHTAARTLKGMFQTGFPASPEAQGIVYSAPRPSCDLTLRPGA